jgi:hypothetical protein
MACQYLVFYGIAIEHSISKRTESSRSLSDTSPNVTFQTEVISRVDGNLADLPRTSSCPFSSRHPSHYQGRSSMMLAICMLVVALLSQAVVGSPPPITEVNPRWKQPRVYKSKPAPRPIHIPADLNLDKLELKDLVEMRPRVMTSEDGKMYKEYFANHPDVKAINLNDDSEPTKVAEAFASLKHDGTPGSKVRLTTSIKDYLREAPFKNESKRDLVLKTVTGIRSEKLRRMRIDRYNEKKGQETIGKMKRKWHDNIAEKTGMSYSTMTKLERKKSPHMNLPLSFHLGGHHLSAVEVEQATRHLAHLYKSQASLTNELSLYLQSKQFPPDQYKLAMAMRANTILELERQKKGRRKQMRQDASEETLQPTTDIFSQNPPSGISRDTAGKALATLSSFDAAKNSSPNKEPQSQSMQVEPFSNMKHQAEARISSPTSYDYDDLDDATFWNVMMNS